MKKMEGVRKMKKVKVIKRYNDVLLNKVQEIGTVLEVEDKRAVHLVNEQMAEYVAERSASEKKG